MVEIEALTVDASILLAKELGLQQVIIESNSHSCPEHLFQGSQ